MPSILIKLYDDYGARQQILEKYNIKNSCYLFGIVLICDVMFSLKYTIRINKILNITESKYIKLQCIIITCIHYIIIVRYCTT